MQFIAENILEICKIVSEESPDPFVREQFKGSEMSFKISKAESEIGNFFSQHEGQTEELKKYCEEYLKNESDMFRLLPMYLVILSTGLDVELNSEQVKSDLRTLIVDTSSLGIENNYEVICELQDFIYALGQYYFDKYQEDPITGMPELEDLAERMIEYVRPFIEAYQEEMALKLQDQPEEITDDEGEDAE